MKADLLAAKPIRMTKRETGFLVVGIFLGLVAGDSLVYGDHIALLILAIGLVVFGVRHFPQSK